MVFRYLSWIIFQIIYNSQINFQSTVTISIGIFHDESISALTNWLDKHTFHYNFHSLAQHLKCRRVIKGRKVLTGSKLIFLFCDYIVKIALLAYFSKLLLVWELHWMQNSSVIYLMPYTDVILVFMGCLSAAHSKLKHLVFSVYTNWAQIYKWWKSLPLGQECTKCTFQQLWTDSLQCIHRKFGLCVMWEGNC